MCNDLKYSAFLLALGILFYACANNTPPKMGFMPNDLEEIKKLPDYEDLSEYRIEDPEVAVVPEISPKESEIPTVFIKYDQPINGYNVTVDLHPDGEDFYGPAELHFSKGNSGFTVSVDCFAEDHFDWETILHDGETITLKHTPLSKGQMISPDCTFFFSDVDFDGVKELLVKEPMYGPRGTNGYHVFELDGTEREDEPFDAICDMTEFNAAEKSITMKYYFGVLIGSRHEIYRRQKDGTFKEMERIHIDYKEDFTDSIRYYYRKQGDEMVLVKTEVVK